MSLGLNIDTDAVDDLPNGLDCLIDALAQMTLPAQVVAVEDGLHRSVMSRCFKLKPETARHIPSGPIPRFFVVAQALCRARRHELTAALRQASGGASAANQRNQ